MLFRRLVVFLALVSCASLVRADDGFKVVLDGLNNPCGLAIQPSTNQVFFSDSGSGRVVRVEDGAAIEVVTGFATEPYGMGPSYEIGPLGLGFLASDLLLVGGGGRPDGEDRLQVFPLKVGAKGAIEIDKAKNSFTLAATDGKKGEGNFFGLAVTSKGVYVTANGDDDFGWVAKAHRNGRTIGPFERHIPTKPLTGVNAPAAITVSPAGELVVGQMGEVKSPGDSQLTFYSESGKKLANFATGLSDITGLAYGPRGDLYATDFAWAEPERGGLYQITVKQVGRAQEIQTKRIAKLERPASLVFAPDGSLYVTVYGAGGEGAGRLLRRAPGL